MSNRLGWALISTAISMIGLAPPGQAQTSSITVPGVPGATVADAIYYNAKVETMDGAGSTASAVAVAGKQIFAVGSKSGVFAYQGPNTQLTNLNGAAILPGFIDPHSHMSAVGIFGDTAHWIDVGSVNVLLKPPCPPGGANPQICFVPVRNEDEVLARIQAQLNAATSSSTPILAFNYDPSRLGAGKGCKDGAIGFECPNLENGQARKTLDNLTYLDPQNPNPVMVTSESGHVNFVNSSALQQLNICGVGSTSTGAGPIVSAPGANSGCYQPTTNPTFEKALARDGQLDEDLSFYSTAKLEGKVVKASDLIKLIVQAAEFYAQRGYTLAQEGAASPSQLDLYQILTRDPKFPVTVAAVVYDATTNDFGQTVDAAVTNRKLAADDPNLIIAAVKSFADGSTQEYTAALKQPYYRVFPPFTRPPFPQPYTGRPDLIEIALGQRIVLAHQAGFPIMIHQNGDRAIARSVRALRSAQTVLPTPDLRDIVLHAPLIDDQELTAAYTLGDTVSFLAENVYYWGQPLCQLVLGPEVSERIYPAASAVAAGLHVTLHSDTTVTPPDPLFAIWVANTRETQQMPWYATDPNCPHVLGKSESISIEQGVRAFTIDAAWQYGLDKQMGSVEVGKLANLVFLSDDPLTMENNPDNLSTVRVLATVHQGKYQPNPNASQPPIWPN
jgi:predicted amidohydrolase YtcJ